jgi:DEAD/DEAH box helicase domain-containing protein
LTNDQYKLLQEIRELKFKAGVYDGDTPGDRRPEIRENANIILTNPYELHQILPYHYKWSNFFRNLKFIVWDEAHSYKGVFGSNIANLIFRLKRILNHYSVYPRHIISTASIGNPVEFAVKLSGENFIHIGINQDGSPQPRKDIILWNTVNSPLSPLRQAKEIVQTLIKLNIRSLCFLKTRRNVELLYSWLDEEKEIVAPYRAGYLPKVRREVESKLKSGQLKAVLATNALELGIDIGSLDAVLIFGFPGSISSFWQQAGRAGRGDKPALIFYLALQDALEQYLINHYEILLDPEFEKLNLTPHNPYIYSRHLVCAASELPVKKEELDSPGREIMENLHNSGVVGESSRGYIYVGGARPQAFVSLENISQDVIEIVVDGKILEVMDYYRALRETYPGAVYLNQGKTYLIQELDLDKKRDIAREENLDYYTQAIQEEEVTITEPKDNIRRGLFKINFGYCEIKEKISGYKIKKGNEVLAYKRLDLPHIEFTSASIWIEIEEEIERAIPSQFDYPGGLHALEHLLVGLAPLIASCDRDDLGGRAYPLYPELGKSCIFIFEAFPGNVGIAEILYTRRDDFLDMAFTRIKECGCSDGCPSCILSPKCGNNNQPMDKQCAIFILNLFFEQQLHRR